MRLLIVAIPLLFLAYGQQQAKESAISTLPHASRPFAIGRADFDWTDETRLESLSNAQEH